MPFDRAKSLNGYTDKTVFELVVQKNLRLDSNTDLDTWSISENPINSNLMFDRENPAGSSTSFYVEPNGDVTFNGVATFGGGLGLNGDLDMNTNDIFNVGALNMVGNISLASNSILFAGGSNLGKITGNVSNSGRLGVFNSSGVEVIQFPIASQVTIPSGITLNVDAGTLFVDPTNNRVGVGTTIPSTPLDVVGDINTTTDYNIGGIQVLSSTTLGSGVVNSSLTSVGTLTSLSSGLINTTGNFTMTKATPTISLAGTTEYLRFIGSVGINYIQSGITLTTGSSADLFIGNMLQNTGSSARKIMFKADGTVGFGTATPSYPLDVVGDINTSTSYRIGGNQVLTSTTLGSGVVNASLTSNTGNLTNTGTLNVTGLTTLGDGTNKDLLTFNTERPWKFTTSGVGAETTLDLVSNQADKDFRIIDNSSSNVALRVTAHPTITSQRVLLCETGGRVGIGLTTPDYTLDVVGDIRTNANVIIGNQLQLVSGATFISSSTNNMTFFTNTTERVRILQNGNVGIGTTPSYKLHVEGEIRASGYVTGDHIRVFRKRATTQSIPNNNPTTVDFDINVKNEFPEWEYDVNTRIFTYNGSEARYFIATVVIVFASNSTGYRKVTLHQSNDPTFSVPGFIEEPSPILISVPAVSGSETSITGTALFRVDVGDGLRVRVIQNSGAPLLIGGSASDTIISIKIVAVSSIG